MATSGSLGLLGGFGVLVDNGSTSPYLDDIITFPSSDPTPQTDSITELPDIMGDSDIFQYFNDFPTTTVECSPDHSPSSNADSPQASPPQLYDLSPDSTNSVSPAVLSQSPTLSKTTPLLPVKEEANIKGTSTATDSKKVSVTTPAAAGATAVTAKRKEPTAELSSSSSSSSPPSSPSGEHGVRTPSSPSTPSNSNNANATAAAGSSSPLGLSRDELLRLSSKGLDCYAQNISSNRNLSVDEERQLKRQRRLIKNRESAQLSRLRKKIYIEELEKKVNQITSESDKLAKQVKDLTADKKQLQEEVMYLRNIIKQSNIQITTTQPPTSSSSTTNTFHAALPQATIHQLQSLQQVQPILVTTTDLNSNMRKGGHGQFPPTYISRNAKIAGVCLFVVLFSFGVLFNGGDLNPAAPTLGDSLEHLSKRSSSSSARGLYTGRVLKSLSEEKMDNSMLPAGLPEPTMDLVPSASVKQQPLSSSLSGSKNYKKHSREEDDDEEEEEIMVDIIDGEKVVSSNRNRGTESSNSGSGGGSSKSSAPMLPPAAIAAAVDHQRRTKMRISSEGSESSKSLVPVVEVSGSSRLVLNGNTHIRSASSHYIYCPEAQQITSGSSSTTQQQQQQQQQQHSGGMPEMIALLIPGSMLNTSDSQLNSSLMEVSCQVLNLHMWPMPPAGNVTN